MKHSTIATRCFLNVLGTSISALANPLTAFAILTMATMKPLIKMTTKTKKKTWILICLLLVVTCCYLLVEGTPIGSLAFFAEVVRATGRGNVTRTTASGTNHLHVVIIEPIVRVGVGKNPMVRTVNTVCVHSGDTLPHLPIKSQALFSNSRNDKIETHQTRPW